MPRCPALLAKASANAAGLTFGEVCALAECWGYKYKPSRSGTSHKKFKHASLKLPSEHAIAVFQDRKGKAVDYQVRQLLDKIEHIKDKFPDFKPQ